MNKVLVVGVPRSGTTWVATILSKCRDTAFVNEPDDERRFNHARDAKKWLGRYPIIAPYDRGRVGESSIVKYQHLWEHAFGPMFCENVIVKSVFVPYCLEWLIEFCGIQNVLLVKRAPMNVLASWYEYSSKVNPDVPKENLCVRLAWQYAMQHQAYMRLLRLKPPAMYAVEHEEIAVNWGKFESLATMLDLEWTHEAAEQLNDLSNEGEGGHPGLANYQLTEHISRAPHQLRRDAWRKRIPERIAELFISELERWSIPYRGELL